MYIKMIFVNNMYIHSIQCCVFLPVSDLHRMAAGANHEIPGIVGKPAAVCL